MSLNYIADYAQNRKTIHDELNKEGIPWNDNIVGRIGEWHAKEYVTKNLISNPSIVWPTVSNSPWDFEVQSKRYSVKVITPENKSGRTSLLKFNNQWHDLIGIYLDNSLHISKLSIIDYRTVLNYAIATSTKYKKTGNQPSNKAFGWWSILDDQNYRKI
jgi:hypothetical protein